MQILNLLFIGTSYFPLELADWEKQLTKVFHFGVCKGGAQPFQVTACSEVKKYFCPS